MGRTVEPWVIPAALPRPEDRLHQPQDEVLLALVVNGLQTRDLLHPVQGPRLRLPLIRLAFRVPVALEAELRRASECPQSGPIDPRPYRLRSPRYLYLDEVFKP